MRTPRSVRHPKKSANRAADGARKRLGILLGAVAAVALLVVMMAGGTTLAANTSASPEQAAAKGKSYKATRAFVLDKQTGKVRMPTQQEVDDVVASLSALGQRPTDTLQQSPQATGAVTVDLDGGFGGVLLARPNEDGSWETRCVFTLEEGAEFLGIVVDESR
jgi:hypothetical protein